MDPKREIAAVNRREFIQGAVAGAAVPLSSFSMRSPEPLYSHFAPIYLNQKDSALCVK